MQLCSGGTSLAQRPRVARVEFPCETNRAAQGPFEAMVVMDKDDDSQCTH